MKYSFFQRNVNDWDKLLTDDLHASSVNTLTNGKTRVSHWGRLHVE